ncbi:MAG: hypothetical protein ABIO50_06580 [Nitrosospira sp.]
MQTGLERNHVISANPALSTGSQFKRSHGHLQINDRQFLVFAPYL